MEKKDLRSGFLWVVLGIVICVGSINLKLGSFSRPGPGFMPFLSGGFLTLFGLILMLSAIPAMIKKGRAQREQSHTKVMWVGISFTLLALLAYGFLLELLGFYTSAFLFLLFLFKFKEPKRWAMPFVIAGMTVALSYMIFSLWLKCQFPRGLLGF